MLWRKFDAYKYLYLWIDIISQKSIRLKEEKEEIAKHPPNLKNLVQRKNIDYLINAIFPFGNVLYLLV